MLNYLYLNDMSAAEQEALRSYKAADDTAGGYSSNKRESFEAMKTSHLQPEIPGIALVSVPQPDFRAQLPTNRTPG